MNNEEILNELRKEMADLFDLDPATITPESTFETMGLTSLDAIDLIVRLQEKTGKKVDEESVKNIRSVADIVALLDKLQKQQG